jgi:hypothetical protein
VTRPELDSEARFFGWSPCVAWDRERRAYDYVDRFGGSHSIYKTLAGARDNTRFVPGGAPAVPGTIGVYDEQFFPIVPTEIAAAARGHRRHAALDLIVGAEAERLVRAWSAIAADRTTFVFAEEMMLTWGELAQRLNTSEALP